MEREFSHISAMGKLRMVDVTSKRVTRRTAWLTVSLFTSVDIGELEARDDGSTPFFVRASRACQRRRERPNSSHCATLLI